MEKKKLNIAMIGHKSIPSRAGGIEVVVEELATRMVEQGHQVTCYNRGDDTKNEMTRGDTYKGVRLKTVYTLKSRGIAALTSSFFASVSAALGAYDIVHFHAEGPCAMLWLPKLFGKRCIATIHGLDHQRAKWGWFASAYIKLGELCAARLADEIIVLNKELEQYFLKEYNRKTALIPNGVHAASPVAADLIRSQYGLEKDRYILFLGRLVPEKGLQNLIEAFKMVDTEKKLVIAGASSDTDGFVKELHQLAAPDERILFTGFVEGQLWQEFYSNAYLYCLPSDLEGMPLSLLEAMSYGNCCLVSDIDACREVLETKGVYFTRGHVEELAGQMQLLCDNPQLVENYKQACSSFVKTKHNWDEVTQKTLSLYFRENSHA